MVIENLYIGINRNSPITDENDWSLEMRQSGSLFYIVCITSLSQRCPTCFTVYMHIYPKMALTSAFYIDINNINNNDNNTNDINTAHIMNLSSTNFYINIRFCIDRTKSRHLTFRI